jgi:hypothetical protein
MLNKIISLSLIIIVFSCKYSKISQKVKNNKEIEIVSKNKINTLKRKLSYKDYMKLINKSKDWINSWKIIDSTFLLNKNFNEEIKGEINSEWFKSKDLGDYINSFDTLWSYSKKNKVIDQYSYNTILKRKNDSIFVSFGVDTKVYIDDGRNTRMVLVTTGSIEKIEDNFWLDENRIILLGYSYENKLTPFIWLFDLKTKEKIRYLYEEEFNVVKKDFLLYKFPHLFNDE